MKRKLILPFLILTAALAVSGCKSKSYEKIDLTSTHTEASKDSEKETLAETATAPTQPEETTVGNAEASVTASLTSYSTGEISIQYPVVSYKDSSSKETKANQLLKDNAMSILTAYEVDESKDSLELECQVISIDRKKICAVYTGLFTADGAAHPQNLFFTNTVDFDDGTNIRLMDYCDAATLADFILSDECQFYNVSAELDKELRKSVKTQDKDYYESLFKQADFSVEENAAFPESFSYEKQGLIYFSIPVQHALGDYAIVKYTPETK
ncbi:MAG: hypothetical protein ACLTKI_08675 [Lachnospiraceae bacterium]